MGDERVRTIMNAMFDGDYRPRSHIVSRIDVLMGNEEAQYVDVRHTPSEASMSGQGIVLTATRVIHAMWSAPKDHDGNTGTVTVTAWARRTVRMAPHARLPSHVVTAALAHRDVVTRKRPGPATEAGYRDRTGQRPDRPHSRRKRVRGTSWALAPVSQHRLMPGRWRQERYASLRDGLRPLLTPPSTC